LVVSLLIAVSAFSLSFIFASTRFSTWQDLARLYRRWIRRPYKRQEYKYERFYLDLPGRFSELLEGFVDKPLRVEVEKVDSGLLIKIKRNNNLKSSSSSSLRG